MKSKNIAFKLKFKNPNIVLPSNDNKISQTICTHSHQTHSMFISLKQNRKYCKRKDYIKLNICITSMLKVATFGLLREIN